MKRLAVLGVLVLAVAACGREGSGGAHGTATLWVTRDRGAHVLLTAKVPAGETAMQALERRAKVETRYGGRYVQAVDGVAGSLAGRRDWFFFVNGIEADRSAAEVTLRAGDVEWWDYRAWPPLSVPVVVGAFPQPFVSDGRAAVVVGSGATARKLARLVHGRVAAAVPKGANVLRIVPGGGFTARRDGGRVVFTLGARDAVRLAADPTLARFRYEGLR